MISWYDKKLERNEYVFVSGYVARWLRRWFENDFFFQRCAIFLDDDMKHECQLRSFPAAEMILSENPDGILLSRANIWKQHTKEPTTF